MEPSPRGIVQWLHCWWDDVILWQIIPLSVVGVSVFRNLFPRDIYPSSPSCLDEWRSTEHQPHHHHHRPRHRNRSDSLENRPFRILLLTRLRRKTRMQHHHRHTHIILTVLNFSLSTFLCCWWYPLNNYLFSDGILHNCFCDYISVTLCTICHSPVPLFCWQWWQSSW